jgi:hypothetical protein
MRGFLFRQPGDCRDRAYRARATLVATAQVLVVVSHLQKVHLAQQQFDRPGQNGPAAVLGPHSGVTWPLSSLSTANVSFRIKLSHHWMGKSKHHVFH